MTQRTRKPCGLFNVTDCNAPGWSCEKCVAAAEFIMDRFHKRRLDMIDQLEKLPILLRSKEKSIMDLKGDVVAMKEYMKGRVEHEEVGQD
jgi:hypothetical protein